MLIQIKPSLLAVGSAAIPVSDIRGVDSLNYSKQEKILRNKTASLYRLADIFAMSNSLITVRESCGLCCIPYSTNLQSDADFLLSLSIRAGLATDPSVAR